MGLVRVRDHDRSENLGTAVETPRMCRKPLYFEIRDGRARVKCPIGAFMTRAQCK